MPPASVDPLVSLRGLPVGLQLDAETLGQAVDVVEVGDDLDDLEDRLVIQSGIPKNLAVPRGHSRRGACEGRSKVNDRSIGGRERIRPFASRELLDEGIVTGETEKDLSVVLQSVVAAVLAGDDRRDHLATDPREA